MNQVLAFSIGLLFTTGIIAVGLGMYGSDASRSGASERQRERPTLDVDTRKLLVGASLGTLLFVLTRWPMMAAWGFAGGWMGVVARDNNRERLKQFAIAQDLVAWVEALRSNVEMGAGLQRAIEITSARTQLAIRDDVIRLADDLKTADFDGAMRDFARRVAHPSVDLIVAILTLVYRRGGSPQRELRSLSRELTAQLRVWHAIEGGKRKIYAQAKTIGAVCCLVIGYLTFFRRGFVQPYDSLVGGTLGLGSVGLLFAVGAWRIRSLGAWEDLERPLRSIERSPSRREVSAR